MLDSKILFQIVEPESYYILCSLFILAWLFYKFFLSGVSDERHRNLQGHFNNILRHFLACSTFFAALIFLSQSEEGSLFHRALVYMGLITLLTGMIVFVKLCRIIILMYLFLGSMKAGVPVLIVNIVSLLLSIGLLIWTANKILGIQVAPLLATSAAFSVILGLAMQDTLGNLFAGISLQLDKNFEIGDWLEVLIGNQRVTGQVKEISWRATLLIGLSEEKITLPNRTLANSQISNFSNEEGHIIRSYSFKISYQVNSDLVKKCLLESIKGVPEVLSYPEPIVQITESNESWVVYKLVYFIENFGKQYSVTDQVIDSALKKLALHDIQITNAKLEVRLQKLN
jgi:small-conductance mechanosensitive channel